MLNRRTSHDVPPTFLWCQIEWEKTFSCLLMRMFRIYLFIYIYVFPLLYFQNNVHNSVEII